jgi:uncharacterized SAM-binding protein YcdF (DUF218 family)
MKRNIVSGAVALLITVGLFLTYGGRFLVYKREVPTTGRTVIISLMGSLPDRTMETREAYTGVRDARILFVSPVDPHKRFLDSIGVPVGSSAHVFSLALQKLGVPGKDIAYLRGPASSTMDEADLTARALKRDSSVTNVVLVTSSHHARRAYLIFRDRYEKAGLGITINVSPSRYTGFDPSGWYRRKQDAVWVSTEWMKLTYYFLIDRYH